VSAGREPPVKQTPPPGGEGAAQITGSALQRRSFAGSYTKQATPAGEVRDAA
jgi:hypothetical protein